MRRTGHTVSKSCDDMGEDNDFAVFVFEKGLKMMLNFVCANSAAS